MSLNSRTTAELSTQLCDGGYMKLTERESERITRKQLEKMLLKHIFEVGSPSPPHHRLNVIRYCDNNDSAKISGNQVTSIK